jgi:putative component of toxin-antitoxin plasmid stabilization module
MSLQPLTYRSPNAKSDFGPGYRVYFGVDGSEIVSLLTGGTKKRNILVSNLD